MYAEFYGLRELPFALTPDPRFIYFTPSHTEVMANLHYGIESGKGLIVVTGEVGTGKFAKVVSVGTEVIIDHIEKDHQVPVMRSVDQGLQILETAAQRFRAPGRAP